jgi:NAD+ kinase
MKYFFVFSDDDRSNDVRGWAHGLPIGDIELADSPHDADVIVVVGGDGTLMHSIHKYFELDIPFLGIDRGTIGFNLNPASTFIDFLRLLKECKNHKVLTLQFIEATVDTADGNNKLLLAFNDVFVESTTMINGRVITEGAYEIDKYFRANGIIVSTAQGSTAYNRSAGGRVLPLEESLLAITTICPQGYPIRKVAEMKQVEVFFKSRSDCVVTVDFQKVSNAVKFVVTPSDKCVRLIFADGSNYQIKRFHIEEEIERRKDKWAM